MNLEYRYNSYISHQKASALAQSRWSELPPLGKGRRDAALSKSHMKSHSQADELRTDIDLSSVLVGGIMIQSSQPRIEGCARLDDAWMPSANRRCNLTLRVCPPMQLQLPEPAGPFGSNIVASSSRLAIVLDGHVIGPSKSIPSSDLTTTVTTSRWRNPEISARCEIHSRRKGTQRIGQHTELDQVETKILRFSPCHQESQLHVRWPRTEGII